MSPIVPNPKSAASVTEVLVAFLRVVVPTVTVSFTVNPAGQAPSMNLNLSLLSLTIEPGTVGLTQITLTAQNNFTDMVTFSCGSLPSGCSCSFNPNPINLSEDGSTTTTLRGEPSQVAFVAHCRGFKQIAAAIASRAHNRHVRSAIAESRLRFSLRAHFF
jgi:hypothetical protein